MNQRGSSSPPLLVYIYASKDRAWRKRLENQLSIGQEQGKFRQWHRDLIDAGERPEVIFQNQLTRATAIVLLLSPDLYQDDFFRYFYAWQKDLPGDNMPLTIPVLVRPTLDRAYYAKHRQILPRNEKALSIWKDEDKATCEVACDILSLIERSLSSGKETDLSGAEPGNLAQTDSTHERFPDQVFASTLPGELEKYLEQLRRCTVRLHVAHFGYWGNGFFVAPGLILTCAHVVQQAREARVPVSVAWKTTHNYQRRIAYVARITSTSYPNLALLKLAEQPEQHACAHLNPRAEINDPIYSFGYSQRYFDGNIYEFTYRGVADEAGMLLTFSGEQVQDVPRGIPLLNMRTGKVCGVVCKSSSESMSPGGRAIPIAHALSTFPELQMTG